MQVIKASKEQDVGECVGWAASNKVGLAIVGTDALSGLGNLAPDTKRNTGFAGPKATLSLAELTGVVDYQPGELFVCARAGTPLVELRALLKEHGQRLAFDPPDLGPFYGKPSGLGTLGGAVAANLAGPGRPWNGGVRDHVLGVRFVNGRAEAISTGGRVFKNVSGYDLSKLMCGSFGTLGVMTEITVKAMPSPSFEETLILADCSEATFEALLPTVRCGSFFPAAVAHLPLFRGRDGVDGNFLEAYTPMRGQGFAALRFEGSRESVQERRNACELALLRDFQQPMFSPFVCDKDASSALWSDLRDLGPLNRAGAAMCWRIVSRQSETTKLLAALREACGDLIAWQDWGGGLVWLGLGEDAGDLPRRLVNGMQGTFGAHAALWRAESSVRRTVPFMQSNQTAMNTLTERVREGFDPLSLLNPWRLHA